MSTKPSALPPSVAAVASPRLSSALQRFLRALAVVRLPEVYRNSWTLLFGFLMLMMGNGVQGSLIAIRSGQEGFSDITTGFVISGYYLGMLFAGILTQGFVERTGHVRVFGALASVASAAILLFFVWVDPLAWFFLRIFVGFCYTGLYIVAESWLNESVSNAFRGRLLSTYMIVHFVGFACGQLLLNVAPTTDATLFILVSVLLSSAIVPMMLSVRPSPKIPDPVRFGVRALYRVSPFGAVAIPMISGTHTSFFAMGGYFGYKAGMSIAEISVMMSALIVSGAVLQGPIGYISDKVDRRSVIMYSSLIVCVGAIFSFLLFSSETPWLTIILFAASGALSLPSYGNCVAHINDLAPSGQSVAISGRVYLLSALGCMCAPLLTAICIATVGAKGFFIFMACSHAAITIFTFYRLRMRGAQGHVSLGMLPLASRVGIAVSQQASYSRSRFLEIRRKMQDKQLALKKAADEKKNNQENNKKNNQRDNKAGKKRDSTS